MDIWEYFIQKEAELDGSGGVPDRPPERVFRAEEGSDRAGIVHTNLILYREEELDVYMRIFERVEVRGNSVHRLAYAYNVIVNGAFFHGWERDPTHVPAVHEHGPEPDRERWPADPMPLKRVFDFAWDEISRRLAAPTGPS